MIDCEETLSESAKEYFNLSTKRNGPFYEPIKAGAAFFLIADFFGPLSDEAKNAREEYKQITDMYAWR